MCPALQAKYRSTAYSGRTATTARMAVARLPEMSRCAASAAHTRRKADATTAEPKTAIAGGGGRWTPLSRSTSAGSATARATAILRMDQAGGGLEERPAL